MGDTLLTRELSPEDREQQRIEAHDWKKLSVIGEVIAEAYLAGEINAEKALKFYHGVLEEFSGAALGLGRGELGKSRLFYTLAKQVYGLTPSVPPTKSRITSGGAPTETLRKLIAKLVDLAREDGFVLPRDDRMSPNSAYKKVKEILDNIGIIDCSVNAIHDYYNKYKERKRS